MGKTHETQGSVVLAYPEVVAEIGLSKSTIVRAVRQGVFPAPVQLSARRVGFRRSDIEVWLQQGGRV